MPQKIKLNMCVNGPIVAFQIDGTSDEVNLKQNHIIYAIEEYVRWVNSTMDILDYPDGTRGMNWEVLDSSARTLYEELKVALKDFYELDFVIIRDDNDNLYK